LNVIHGLGSEAGAPLVEHPDVDLVSFTGSAATGRWINETAGRRLAKVCLELGGKNAFVVCDDADLDAAVQWAPASAFSNAGQRCALAALVFDRVYDAFRDRLLAGVRELDPQPVISREAWRGSPRRSSDQLTTVLTARRRRAARPAGWFFRSHGGRGGGGDAEISREELFGPSRSLSRPRSRGGDRARQRLGVRIDGGDPRLASTAVLCRDESKRVSWS
jgi:aldehyde dehydrogenase (NAD+)